MRKKETKSPSWIRYDFLISPSGEPLHGVTREMVLMPVKVDHQGNPLKEKSQTSTITNLSSIKKRTGRSTRKDLIQIQWLWPGHRVKTLLDVLKIDKLTGSALSAARALNDVVNGKVKKGKEYKWAKALLLEEREHKLQARERKRAEDKSRDDAERRRYFGSARRRKQKPGAKGASRKTVGREPTEGRPRRSYGRRQR